MANTLTGLIPVIYRVLDVVSREITGLIPAVTWDADSARAALNQTITIPTSEAGTAENVTPATTPPDTGDQSFGNESITITKARAVPFRWNGEQSKSMGGSGPGRLSLQEDQIAQAIRVLVNEIESDLGSLYVRTARAIGTAGTTPFASNIDLLVDAQKALTDIGCPRVSRQLVMDTSAGANMRKLSNLQKVNESGNDSLLRQGVLESLMGFDIRESSGINLHTAGTGAATYVTNGTFAVGATTIAVDTGSGTVLPGDVVSFTGDAKKYVVATALSGGSFTIGKPGLAAALADGVTMTLTAGYRGNMAFHRGSIVLVTRPPAVPEEGDMADDAMVITDPQTGLSFEIRMYKQYRRVRYEVALAWGYANIKPAHTLIIQG